MRGPSSSQQDRLSRFRRRSLYCIVGSRTQQVVDGDVCLDHEGD